MCAPQPTHPRCTAEVHPDKMGRGARGASTAPPDGHTTDRHGSRDSARAPGPGRRTRRPHRHPNFREWIKDKEREYSPRKAPPPCAVCAVHTPQCEWQRTTRVIPPRPRSHGRRSRWTTSLWGCSAPLRCVDRCSRPPRAPLPHLPRHSDAQGRPWSAGRSACDAAG